MRGKHDDEKTHYYLDTNGAKGKDRGLADR